MDLLTAAFVAYLITHLFVGLVLADAVAYPGELWIPMMLVWPMFVFVVWTDARRRRRGFLDSLRVVLEDTEVGGGDEP